MHGIKKPRKPKPEAAPAAHSTKTSSPQKLQQHHANAAASEGPVIRSDNQGHDPEVE
jgi:hypothetical protein